MGIVILILNRDHRCDDIRGYLIQADMIPPSRIGRHNLIKLVPLPIHNTHGFELGRLRTQVINIRQLGADIEIHQQQGDAKDAETDQQHGQAAGGFVLFLRQLRHRRHGLI